MCATTCGLNFENGVLELAKARGRPSLCMALASTYILVLVAPGMVQPQQGVSALRAWSSS